MMVSSRFLPTKYFGMNQIVEGEDMVDQERIKEFKETTPPGILKQFKDDQDISDYLSNEGEWEGATVIKDIDIVASTKEEAEIMIRDTIYNLFGGQKS